MKSKTWIIGAVVIVVIGVVIYFVMKNKEKSKSTSVESSSDGSVKASLPVTEVKPEDIVQAVSDVKAK